MAIIDIIRRIFCSNQNIIDGYKVKIAEYEEALTKAHNKILKIGHEKRVNEEAEYWNNKWKKADIKYKSRYIPNSSIFFEIDVRNFIHTNSCILRDIVDNFNLKQDNNDLTAKACYNWVIRWIKYRSDIQQQKVNEFWKFSFETIKTKTGDCEDGAILLLSLMAVAGIPAYRRKICAGWVKHKGNKIGHAYVIYLDDNNRWIPLDWCFYPQKNKELNEITEHKLDSHYEDIWFTFNEEYAWRQNNFIVKGNKLNG